RATLPAFRAESRHGAGERRRWLWFGVVWVSPRPHVNIRAPASEGGRIMDSQGNPQDLNVWGSSPSDAWGQVQGTDVHGNEPHDVFGNYTGHADGLGGTE